MNRAIAYIRVSTDRQATEGDSLDMQEERLRAYATAKQLDLIEVVRDEGVSGSIPLGQRPGGARVMAMLEQGTHLLVLKFDRIFRDAADAMNMIASFDKGGVIFHSLDFGGMTFASGSSMSKAMLQMRAVFAELERSLARERTADTMLAKRQRGERIGQIPFGYTADEDGQLTEHPARAKVVKQMCQLRESGKSFRVIADLISSDHADKNFRISHVTVQKILTEERIQL